DPVVAEEDAEALRGAGEGLTGRVVSSVRRFCPGAGPADILGWIDHGRPAGVPGRFWTLDPIDGTKGFLRGEQYAVALALIVEGEVVLGVLGCPNLPVDADRPGSPRGCLFAAVRGEGVRMRPFDGAFERDVRVSDAAD